MREELLRHLRTITAEELALRQEGGAIQKSLYASGNEFVVDRAKLMEPGKLINIRPHTRFVPFPRHKHNYVELIYMCEGSTTHIINGRETVTLSQGELLFLNQHCYHEVLPARESDVGVNFLVMPEFFRPAFDMMDMENDLSNFIISALTQDTGNTMYLHFQVSDVPPVQNLVENLVWTLIRRQAPDNQVNQMTMALLLFQLMEYTDKLSSSDPRQYDRMLALSVLRYIDEHFCSGSLQEFAAWKKQPVSRLSRLIRENTGSTFRELMQAKRMEIARDLILTSPLPLSDIIAAVGYENTGHFYRTFREKYGVSPGECRRQSKERN